MIPSLGALLMIVSMFASPTPTAAAPETKRATNGVADLGWNLVRAAGTDNVIVSPLGVWAALAMTHAGARGATASEIASVLGMPDDAGEIATAWRSVRSALAAAKGDAITLELANRLWLQQGAAITRPFIAHLEDRVGAGAEPVDFAGAADAARATINRWVERHTAGKISELLKPGTVDPLSRLVVTNAVYMKAPWAAPFDRAATRPAPFALGSGEPVDVPFMHRTGSMTAGKIAGATVVEIPYAGAKLAMIVVVPDDVAGASGILAGLRADSYERWRVQLKRRPVALALPRFTARSPLSLADALRAMGMRAAFEANTADFSGIDGTRDLFLSTVVHEGFVDVTEEGTEAAAATGVVASSRRRPSRQEPLEVKADRPFLWAVVERGTGAMLFAGMVRDPRK